MAHKFLIRDMISLVALSVRFFEKALLRASDLKHIGSSISQRLLFRFELIGTCQRCQRLRVWRFLMCNHTSIVLTKSIDMNWGVVHDWGQSFVSDKLMKSAVIERSIDADHASEEDIFHTFLLD